MENSGKSHKNSKKNQANIIAKECMTGALIKLLEEKPLSAISISELTERAGVSRMTYYRNYHTKEDIFAVYLKDSMEYYHEDVKTLMLQGNYCDVDNLIHCFRYMKKHRVFLDALFKSGFGYLLLQTICDYVIKTWYQEGDSSRHYYTVQAFSGALYNLYIAWSENDMKESPEYMAQVLHDIYRATADV